MNSENNPALEGKTSKRLRAKYSDAAIQKISDIINVEFFIMIYECSQNRLCPQRKLYIQRLYFHADSKRFGSVDEKQKLQCAHTNDIFINA